MKTKFLYLTIILLLYSCETDWGNFGGYCLDYNEHDRTSRYLILDKGNIRTAVDTEKEMLKKGILVKYYSNSSKVDTFLLCKEDIIIDSYIEDFNFDNTFILVDQKPIDSIFGVTKEYFDKNHVPYLMRIKEPTKKALNESNFHQYWIINKLKDNIYGPFNKKEYYLKKRELGITDNLRLKFEKD